VHRRRKLPNRVAQVGAGTSTNRLKVTRACVLAIPLSDTLRSLGVCLLLVTQDATSDTHPRSRAAVGLFALYSLH
jgi:hypothetical protein